MSLENVDFEKPRNANKKINSPNSLEALFRLGFAEEDLYFLPFKNFLNLYPNIRTFPKGSQISTYEYYEAKRQEKIQLIRAERRRILDQNKHEGNINTYIN